MNKYPPMNALLAFEAAARFQSFTRAAQELNVTTGAIGQQIKKLEQWLDTELFIRQTRQLVLTEDGVKYYQQMQPALMQINKASNELRQKHQNNIYLSMPPVFAAKWFSPRMSSFISRFPQLSLHLNASSDLVDLEYGNIDLAVRLFDGRDPALDTTLLVPDRLKIYAHPAYLQDKKIREPNDLKKATFLHSTLHPYWHEWLANYSTMSPAEIDRLPSIHFNQLTLAIDAAKQQQGVILVSELLINKEIKIGSLVKVFDFSYSTGKGFYLVHSKKKRMSKEAQAVKAWILQQIDKDKQLLIDRDG